MKASKKCIDLVKQFEGCKLKAYKDPVGIWTIGIGTIMYPDGKRVKQGDIITMQQAEEFLMHELNIKALAIQHHFFNVLKKVKANPNDKSIEMEFMKWTKGGGKVLPGLVKRRQAESDLYFS